MSLSLAFALGAASATMSIGSVNVITQVTLTPKELRERQRRDAKIARLCRKALDRRDALASLDADADTLADVAERLWYGHLGCHKNPGLAIAVQRFAIGGDALHFGDVERVTQLARYLRDRGDAADQIELLELEGILWVRGTYFSFSSDGKPQWSAEQKRAFIARDDIWAFLAEDTKVPWLSQQARLEALRDPLSPRYAPAEAVTIMEAGLGASEWVEAAKLLRRGQRLPRDDVRADALLLRAAPYVDEARLLLEPVLARQLKSPDATVRAAALQQYDPWSRLVGPGATALRAALAPYYQAQLAAPMRNDQGRAVQALTRYAVVYPDTDPAALLRWIDTALRTGDDNDRALGWRSLGSLANAKTPGAGRVMNDAFARAGGLVDGGTIKAAELMRIVTNDDYPARALRYEREGVVESEAIITPDGRALMVIITRSPEKALGDEVQKLVMRRLRAKNLLPFPGRYVRAKLPPIQFRIRPCLGKGEVTPAVDGALLIEGQCIERPNLEVPIS
jgi:hypothetical protein